MDWPGPKKSNESDGGYIIPEIFAEFIRQQEKTFIFGNPLDDLRNARRNIIDDIRELRYVVNEDRDRDIVRINFLIDQIQKELES